MPNATFNILHTRSCAARRAGTQDPALRATGSGSCIAADIGLHHKLLSSRTMCLSRAGHANVEVRSDVVSRWWFLVADESPHKSVTFFARSSSRCVCTSSLCVSCRCYSVTLYCAFSASACSTRCLSLRFSACSSRS